MGGFSCSHIDGVARRVTQVVAGLAVVLLASSALHAAPAIRTSDDNRVPRCATPERLMAFVRERNPAVDPRFATIAGWYKYYGEAWHVRWDYAFFQMVLETNALKFRRNDGQRGDVHETQNNFAGLGATGGGVAGDRFPDIKTGVHAQIQHLVAYSGERLADPISPRTQLRQNDIIDESRRLRRPVTFADLGLRWAADRTYAKSIDTIAEQYRTNYCQGLADATAPVGDLPPTRPAPRRGLAGFAPPSGLDGPKPLNLAGPDELPWSDAPGQQAAVTGQQPATSPVPGTPVAKQPDTPPKALPVRTIWSRDGKMPPAAAEPQKARRHAERAAESTKLDQPIITATPVATPASDDAPALPHFKIGPSVPAPSRLGGPVDALPLTTAPAAVPNVHFNEIIVPGPQTSAPASNPCRILAASYGGTKTLLVRGTVSGETRYTALTVLDGFEKSMFDTFAKAAAPGAEIVGEYASKEDALADARANCPSG